MLTSENWPISGLDKAPILSDLEVYTTQKFGSSRNSPNLYSCSAFFRYRPRHRESLLKLGSHSGGYEIIPCSPLRVNWRFGVNVASIFRIEEQAKQAILATCFYTGFLFGLFFDPEYWGDMFLRNARWLSTEYTGLHCKWQNSSILIRVFYVFFPKSLETSVRKLPWIKV
jgi:hypothetical protein